MSANPELHLRAIDPARVVVPERERVRKDFGDLDELADSMERCGQLHPVVIRSDRTLVVGERRLRACKARGRKVLVRVVDTAQEALDAIDAEAAENLCRKPWTKTEAFEYARRREELEREAAADRKAAGQRKGGRAKAALASGTADPEAQGPEPAASGEQGRAATRAALAAGFGSRKEYERVGQVVEAARAEPEKYGPLLEELDQGGKASAVAAKLERLREGCDPDSYATPPWVPEGIRKVEGRRIDLDPATNANARALGFIDAWESWTIDDDALAQETWAVRDGDTLAFMNPPYSDPAPLVERLVAEWDAGHLGRAYALVKLDTSTSWWALLRDRAAAIVLPRRRVAHYVGSAPRKGSDFCSGMPVLARGTRAELLELWGRLVEAFEGEADVYLSPWVRKVPKHATSRRERP